MDPIFFQVMGVLVEELREQAPSVAAALIAAERSDLALERKERVAEVYRYAHSLKGNAATLGLTDLVELAHAAETALVPYREGEFRLPASLAADLLSALDLAQLHVQGALQGREGPDPAVLTLVAHLGTLSDKAPPPLAAVTPPAAESLAPAEPVLPERAGSIRVSIDRLEALDRQLDELREVKATLEHRAHDARELQLSLEAAFAGGAEGEVLDKIRQAQDRALALARGLSTDVSELAAQLSGMDEELRQARMLPSKILLEPLGRSVWEHAQSLDKQARLELSGEQVALDRRLLQELKDPLLHLVRNAVDHGIENPAKRADLAKPPEGIVRIAVEARGGNRVHFVITDDGQGIDFARVRRKAVERGLCTEEEAAGLDEREVAEFIFSPGFSTAQALTRTSGRGVGLDVVKENVQRLGGNVTVSSQAGKGTRFVLEVPLTVATEQALLVEAAGFTVALPLGSVLAAQHVALKGLATPEYVHFGEQAYAIQWLAPFLGVQSRHEPRRRSFPVVLVRGVSRIVALRVDRLLGERDVVVRAMPPELASLRQVSGAASLGDGRLVFLINVRALAEASIEAQTVTPETAPRRRRVLVADDSITTRSLHRQVLEAAGFEVETASDGAEAYRHLQNRGADLLVSDVRMPNLDGLSLTRQLRREPAWTSLPIILISSLDSDEDRLRANEAGASAYLTKASYERGELLRLVRNFLS